MPQYSLSQLRQFRKSVSILKKKGLLTGVNRWGKPVDARSAYPTTKINGKSLKSLVAKYDDVVSGKSEPIKVPAKKLKQFRKAGFSTANGRVLVPHSANETARLIKGEVVIKSTLGIERVQVPVPYENLHQYLTDIKKDSKKINRMKRRGESFGFRFYGHNSIAAYDDIDDAIDDLFTRYESIDQALAEKSPMKQRDVYRNLEFIRITRRGEKHWEDQQSNRKPSTSKGYAAARSKRFRERIKDMPQWKQDKIAEGTARRMQEYRKRLKRSKKADKSYKKAARVRAKKSKDLLRAEIAKHKAALAKRRKKTTKKRSDSK